MLISIIRKIISLKFRAPIIKTLLRHKKYPIKRLDLKDINLHLIDKEIYPSTLNILNSLKSVRKMNRKRKS